MSDKWFIATAIWYLTGIAVFTFMQPDWMLIAWVVFHALLVVCYVFKDKITWSRKIG